ncbi:MAG: zinc ribbon domain-containing protein [Verrucomicrobiae bacterium]|nr:zinc ribbon domain-containing protein [Verrucomicrobiae bacterium]
MPTYDYKCLSCQKKFSVRMTITEHEKRKAKCPKCGSQKLEQQIQSFYAITSKKS